MPALPGQSGMMRIICLRPPTDVRFTYCIHKSFSIEKYVVLYWPSSVYGGIQLCLQCSDEYHRYLRADFSSTTWRFYISTKYGILENAYSLSIGCHTSRTASQFNGTGGMMSCLTYPEENVTASIGR